MNIVKLSKTAILSAIVCLSIPFGISSSFAIEPSPYVGGPVLTVYNYTKYDLTFTVEFPYYLNEVAKDGKWLNQLRNYINGTEKISVLARQCTGSPQILKFISQDDAKKHEYWFGIPETISGTLVITSSGTAAKGNCTANEAWPTDGNRYEQSIILNLQKGKSVYTKSICPFEDRDTYQGKTVTPSIDCCLEWNKEDNNGWKVTLKRGADLDLN